MKTGRENFLTRRKRTRYQLKRKNPGRPRLSVHRSNKNIYAQVIDDQKGVTVAAASSLDKDLRDSLDYGGNVDAATAVGKLIAERARKAGVDEVVFDRGGFIYHGRVKALADSARDAGLSF